MVRSLDESRALTITWLWPLACVGCGPKQIENVNSQIGTIRMYMGPMHMVGTWC